MEQLGHGGAGGVHNVLLQSAGGQQGVHVQLVQPPGQLLHRGWVRYAVHKHYGQPGLALAAHVAFHQLQLGGAYPPAHQGGVYPQSLHKRVLSPLERLFQGGLGDAAHVAAAHLKADGTAYPIQNDGAVSVAQVVHQLVHGAAFLGGVAVGCTQKDVLKTLLLALYQRTAPGLGQRAYYLLRHGGAGDQPVQPAYLQLDILFQTQDYLPALVVAAAGEDLFKILRPEQTFVLRKLLPVIAPGALI